MTLRFVISLIFALLVAVFALQNSMSVTINFFSLEFSISQALVILISAAIGAIIVLILGTIKQVKTNMKIRNQTKTINGLEEQNKKLEEQNKELEKQIEQDTKNFNMDDNIEEDNLDIDNEITNQ